MLAFQKATITVLLQSGADATVCSPTGETALSFAACQGQLDAVEQLLEYGADPDIANVVCSRRAIDMHFLQQLSITRALQGFFSQWPNVFFVDVNHP